MSLPLFPRSDGPEQHDPLDSLSLPNSPELTPRERLLRSIVSKIDSAQESGDRSRVAALQERLVHLTREDASPFPLRGGFRAADVITSLGFAEETRFAELSDEGDFVVLGARDGAVRVISLNERDVDGRLKVLSSCNISYPVTSLAITPGGGSLIVGGEDRSLRIYSLEETVTGFSALEGRPYHRPRELFRSYLGSLVTALAHDPSGTLLAVGSGLEEGGLVRLLDIIDPMAPREVLQFPVKTQRPALAFSPDGRYLAVGGVRTFILPVDEDEWKKGIRRIEEWADALTFSPDGRYLVVGGGADHRRDRVRVFGIDKDPFENDPVLLSTTRVYQPVRSLQFAPGGDVLSVGLQAPLRDIGRLLLFEVTGKGAVLEQVGSCSLLRPLKEQSFSGDGQRIALVGEDRIVWIFGKREPYLPYEI